MRKWSYKEVYIYVLICAFGTSNRIIQSCLVSASLYALEKTLNVPKETITLWERIIGWIIEKIFRVKQHFTLTWQKDEIV